ncbi:MAG: NUDIX hydrolase [Planctomycetia bacterium]|nr:NUDIX hydrolase [Planctomycetia bacterium]
MPLAQSSVIPFRAAAFGLEFCLITSIRARKWGFPKGLIDPGETAIESGLKEAWEEAGLRGQVIGEALGDYRYEKWGETLEVAVYVMHVETVEDDWLESAMRERRWADADEAKLLIAKDPRATFFPAAIDQAQRWLAANSGQ